MRSHAQGSRSYLIKLRSESFHIARRSPWAVSYRGHPQEAQMLCMGCYLMGRKQLRLIRCNSRMQQLRLGSRRMTGDVGWKAVGLVKMWIFCTKSLRICTVLSFVKLFCYCFSSALGCRQCVCKLRHRYPSIDLDATFENMQNHCSRLFPVASTFCTSLTSSCLD